MKKLTNNKVLELIGRIKRVRQKGDEIFEQKMPFKFQYAIDRTIERLEKEADSINKILVKHRPKDMKEGEQFTLTQEVIDILNAESELKPYVLKSEIQVDDISFSSLEYEIASLILPEEKEENENGMPEGPDPT